VGAGERAELDDRGLLEDVDLRLRQEVPPDLERSSSRQSTSWSRTVEDPVVGGVEIVLGINGFVPRAR